MISSAKKHTTKVLRWTERFTKTDMVYLAKGGFWLFLGQVGAAGAAFGLSVAIARFVSPENFGSYKFLISIGSVFGALSLTGLGTTLVRSVARGYGGTVQTAFYESLKWSWPSVLATLVAAGYYLIRGNDTYALCLAIIAFSTPIANAAALYGPYLSGLKDFYRSTTYWTASNLATTSMIVVAAFSGSFVWLVVAASAGGALSTFITYQLVLHKQPPQGGIDPEAPSYSRHLSLINLLDTVTGQADKLLVYHFLGPVAMATYAFAVGMPEQFRALIKSGARIASPKFSEQSFESIQRGTGIKVARFALIATVAAVAYIIAAPFLFRIFFPAYLSAIPYSQVLSLSMLSALGQVPLAALQAHAKRAELYRYSIIANIVQLATSVTLIGGFGLWGAVASTLVNRTVSIALPLRLLGRAR